MREGLLVRLVSLSSDKRQAEGIVSDFQKLERAIAALEPGNMKYARHKSVVHAILDFLDEVGRPVPAEEIVSALASGGFRGGGEAIKANIRRSLSSFTEGAAGTRLRQIKEVNGLMGKRDWPDDRFTL